MILKIKSSYNHDDVFVLFLYNLIKKTIRILKMVKNGLLLLRKKILFFNFNFNLLIKTGHSGGNINNLTNLLIRSQFNINLLIRNKFILQIF